MFHPQRHSSKLPSSCAPAINRFWSHLQYNSVYVSCNGQWFCSSGSRYLSLWQICVLLSRKKVNRIKLHWLAYMATRWTWRRHWKSHTLLLTLRHGPENLNCPRTVQRRFEMRQFSGTTYSMTVQNLRFSLRKTKSRMKYFFAKRKEREIILGKNHSSFVY